MSEKGAKHWWHQFLYGLAFALGSLWASSYLKTIAPDWTRVPINVTAAVCFLLGLASALGSLILMCEAGKKNP